MEELYAQFSRVYDSLIEKPKEIFQIFVEFFGEDLVDFEFPSKEFVWDRLKIIPIGNLGTAYSLPFVESSSEFEIKNLSSVEFLLSKNIEVSDSEMMYLIRNTSLNDIPLTTNILVKFPNVRVTNENNKSIDIEDLFARIKVKEDGCLEGTFRINRTTFPAYQWWQGYLHSHIPSIPENKVPVWQSPCLGTGPLMNTCGSLASDSNKDLWGLFAYELSLYVQNESLHGVPYRYLERVISSNITYTKLSINYKYRPTLSTDFARFAPYNNLLLKSLLENNIVKFSFVNNSWQIAMTQKEFIYKVSNEFIRLHNANPLVDKSELLTKLIILETVEKDGELHTFYDANSYTGIPSCNGQGVLTFKGEIVRLNVYEASMSNDDFTDRVITILNPVILNHILTKLIIMANCNYGKSKQRKIFL